MDRLQVSKRELLRYGSLGVAISCLAFSVSNWKVLKTVLLISKYDGSQFLQVLRKRKSLLCAFFYVVIVHLQTKHFLQQFLLLPHSSCCRQCSMLLQKLYGICCLESVSHLFSEVMVCKCYFNRCSWLATNESTRSIIYIVRKLGLEKVDETDAMMSRCLPSVLHR